MQNQETFKHYQPMGGSDPAHTAIGVSGITVATPAFTPLMLHATNNTLIAWDGVKAGTAVAMLALAVDGTQSRLTYYKTGTFRAEDIAWPPTANTDALKFNAFTGTSISIV